MPTLEERFEGGLLGLAVGDALGAGFEGQSPEWIRSRFPRPLDLVSFPPHAELCYTDDTQMAIGVAETLAAHGEILEDELCRAFVSNYAPSRGYGSGARRVLETMKAGGDYRRVARTYFPGGSYGNGAAMRVAPVGLFFRDDLDAAWAQARASALPTHMHPLGIEGAQLLAVAAALASHGGERDREELFAQLRSRCQFPEFEAKLEMASRVETVDDLATLGNGIEAVESVPTAIACFALTPDSYASVVGNAISLGGDTDTIAAMGGALAGASGGVGAIPEQLLAMLEDRGKGRSYLRQLASRLCEAYRTRRGNRGMGS
jgi:poly(ADP-ribose) glycohydrolase ARH3